MKKYLYLLGIVVPVALCLLGQGCKTKSNLLKGPYSDYRSDALFFRAVGIGEDKDMQVAKSKATHRAKLEIARNASSVCQQIVLDYLDQTGNGHDVSLKEQFISVSVESVSASLVNVNVEDVFFKQEKDGRYTAYALVKVATGNVIDTFAGHSQEKMAFNKEIFKQASDKAINRIDGKP
jgi:hypothetical protein